MAARVKQRLDPLLLESFRVTLERMLIRDMAGLLGNKKVDDCIQISEYKLANDKIDLR